MIRDNTKEPCEDYKSVSRLKFFSVAKIHPGHLRCFCEEVANLLPSSAVSSFSHSIATSIVMRVLAEPFRNRGQAASIRREATFLTKEGPCIHESVIDLASFRLAENSIEKSLLFATQRRDHRHRETFDRIAISASEWL